MFIYISSINHSRIHGPVGIGALTKVSYINSRFRREKGPREQKKELITKERQRGSSSFFSLRRARQLLSKRLSALLFSLSPARARTHMHTRTRTLGEATGQSRLVFRLRPGESGHNRTREALGGKCYPRIGLSGAQANLTSHGRSGSLELRRYPNMYSLPRGGAAAAAAGEKSGNG